MASRLTIRESLIAAAALLAGAGGTTLFDTSAVPTVAAPRSPLFYDLAAAVVDGGKVHVQRETSDGTGVDEESYSPQYVADAILYCQTMGDKCGRAAHWDAMRVKLEAAGVTMPPGVPYTQAVP